MARMGVLVMHDYVLKGPIYLIADRRQPEGSGWLSSQWKGKKYPLLFTSVELVNCYINDAGKLDWMVIEVLDTPSSFLGFLKAMGSQGCKYLGINAPYKKEPKEIVPLSSTLSSLKKMLSEMN